MESRGRPAKNSRSEIGERIVAARKRLGITQVELAESLGVSQQTVAFWEREAPTPRAEYLGALAKALNMTVDALLLGDDAEPKRPRRGAPSRLERQLDQIRQLPKDKQKAISTVLDMALQNVGE